MMHSPWEFCGRYVPVSWVQIFGCWAWDGRSQAIESTYTANLVLEKVGILAAAGLYALEHNLARLKARTPGAMYSAPKYPILWYVLLYYGILL